MSIHKTTQKRRYRLITPAVVARHKAATFKEGNASAAVRATEGDSYEEEEAQRRAWLIKQKAKQLDAGEYIDNQLQQIGIEAVERVGELVQSADEGIATRNSQFVIDHVRGKALQRSETKHLNLNIEAVLGD